MTALICSKSSFQIGSTHRLRLSHLSLFFLNSIKLGLMAAQMAQYRFSLSQWLEKLIDGGFGGRNGGLHKLSGGSVLLN